MPVASSTKTKKKRKPAATSWSVVVPKDLAEESSQIAISVADRFLEGELLAENMKMLPSQSTDKIPIGMDGPGLMQGFAGFSALYGHLRRCQPDEDWNSPANHFLKIAAEYLDYPILQKDISICSGVSGVAYAAIQSYRAKSTFKSLIAKSNDIILNNVQDKIKKVETPGGLAAIDYDALYGVAGIGRYLLAGYSLDERLLKPLEQILKALIDRSALVDGFPNLYTAEESLTELEKENYNCRVVNCGLAHGVPSVLTLLALALQEGLEVQGLKAAVEFWSNWLQGAIVKDQWGINWPSVVPVDNRDLKPARAAWCYGTPGLANSLWLAGEALDDSQAKAVAVEGMEAVYKRPVPVQGILSPCLCHGTSGLLQVTVRFANRTGLPVFAEASTDLLGKIVAEYDPSATYWGFADRLPEGQRTDLPTLLNGAAGVILPMLAASCPAEPVWDQTLMIS
jgi:lantibiotic biosynthesis protein